MRILTVCSSTFSLALHRTSAWDPEQRLLQVLGCFCSYLSTVEHRVSNLKATMHYALVMVSITAFVCHAVIRKSDIEVASNSQLLLPCGHSIMQSCPFFYPILRLQIVKKSGIKCTKQLKICEHLTNKFISIKKVKLGIRAV